MTEQICKACGNLMYTRKSGMSGRATTVFLCPKCSTVLYVWPDGDRKWEPDREVGANRKT